VGLDDGGRSSAARTRPVREIGLAAERALDLLEEARGPQEVLGGDVERDGSEQLHAAT